MSQHHHGITGKKRVVADAVSNSDNESGDEDGSNESLRGMDARPPSTKPLDFPSPPSASAKVSAKTTKSLDGSEIELLGGSGVIAPPCSSSKKKKKAKTSGEMTPVAAEAGEGLSTADQAPQEQQEQDDNVDFSMQFNQPSLINSNVSTAADLLKVITFRVVKTDDVCGLQIFSMDGTKTAILQTHTECIMHKAPPMDPEAGMQIVEFCMSASAVRTVLAQISNSSQLKWTRLKGATTHNLWGYQKDGSGLTRILELKEMDPDVSTALKNLPPLEWSYLVEINLSVLKDCVKCGMALVCTELTIEVLEYTNELIEKLVTFVVLTVDGQAKSRVIFRQESDIPLLNGGDGGGEGTQSTRAAAAAARGDDAAAASKDNNAMDDTGEDGEKEPVFVQTTTANTTDVHIEFTHTEKKCIKKYSERFPLAQLEKAIKSMNKSSILLKLQPEAPMSIFSETADKKSFTNVIIIPKIPEETTTGE
jgi:hypothetical protein